jgi:hypothetical protein
METCINYSFCKKKSAKNRDHSIGNELIFLINFANYQYIFIKLCIENYADKLYIEILLAPHKRLIRPGLRSQCRILENSFGFHRK